MNKYAVLVGIGDNQQGTKLYMDRYARTLQKLLRSKGFSNIKMLLNNRADREAVLNAISVLRDKEGEVVVYIGSHGSSSMMLMDDGALTGAMLNDALSGFVSEKQLVMLYACGSGGLMPYIEADNRISLTASGAYSVPSAYDWEHKFLPALETSSVQEAWSNNYPFGKMVDNYNKPYILGKES